MSPEAATNIIFGIIMILLGVLEMILGERLVSRRQSMYATVMRPCLIREANILSIPSDVENQVLQMTSLNTAP